MGGSLGLSSSFSLTLLLILSALPVSALVREAGGVANTICYMACTALFLNNMNAFPTISTFALWRLAQRRRCQRPRAARDLALELFPAFQCCVSLLDVNAGRCWCACCRVWRGLEEADVLQVWEDCQPGAEGAREAAANPP